MQKTQFLVQLTVFVHYIYFYYLYPALVYIHLL